jgi:GMP reductase
VDFDSVWIKPRLGFVRSRADVDLSCQYRFLHSQCRYAGIPLVASNMEGVGEPGMVPIFEQYGAIVVLRRYADAGASPSVFVTASLHDVPVFRNVCIDVANGYQPGLYEAVRLQRQMHPGGIVIAGNVVTPEAAVKLIESGADIVKVGLGSGSACATREKTGVGYPQLLAVKECSEAVHRLGGHVISDGGCRVPGDVAKAFAAGADFVMMGYMFAGTTEGGASAELRGSARLTGEYQALESKTISVPQRGSVEAVLSDIMGGLRSTCAYVGASRLNELQIKAEFVEA